jgi:hypothetical protein
VRYYKALDPRGMLKKWGFAIRKCKASLSPMLSKEETRQKRKEAYQKAKAKRDADPCYQALKEKIKQDRKDKYRAHRNKIKKAKEEEKQIKRAAKDEALKAFLCQHLSWKNEIKQPFSSVLHN